MKKVLLTLTLASFLGLGMLQAQAPKAINYQAIARDGSGNLMISKKISVKMNILSGSASGSQVYSETFSDVATNGYGQFNLQIGTGKSSTSFSNINWGSNNHFLQVEADVNNGTSFTTLGTQQLVSVPYAIFADKVGNIGDKSLSDLKNVKGSPTTGQVLKYDGSNWVAGNDSVGSGSGASSTVSAFSYNNSTGVISITVGSGSKTITINEKADDLSDNKLSDLKGIASKTPTTGQVLKFDGTNWAPGNDSIGSLAPSTWKTTGSDIYYNLGKVGVGTNSPQNDFDLKSILTTKKTTALNLQATVPNSGNSFSGATFELLKTGSSGPLNAYGVVSSSAYQTSNAFNVGVLGTADSSDVANRGVLGFTKGTGYQNVGVFGISNGLGGSSSANYGLYGSASGSSNQNIGVVGNAFTDGKFNYGMYARANKYNSNTNTGITCIADSGSANYGIYAVGPNSSYTGYAGYFVGDVYTTGSYKTSSDAKLKKDVESIQSPLSSIMKLQPKKYHYKTEEFSKMNLSKGLQYGFIAQDLEKVFPALVSENKSKVFIADLSNASNVKNTGKSDAQIKGEEREISLKDVNYQGLIPVLTGAIQEQQALIEAQKETIELLMKRLEVLENKVNSKK